MLRLTLFDDLPGAPCVYYTTRSALRAGKIPTAASFRKDKIKWAHDLRAFFKQVIACAQPTRRCAQASVEVLRSGEVVIYLRRLDETFVVALNRSAQTLHLDIPAGSLPGRGAGQPAGQRRGRASPAANLPG